MKKALYRMLQSSLLYYNFFWKDLEGQGFKINPYNPYVAYRTIEGTQHTVTWHMDDLKSSLQYVDFQEVQEALSPDQAKLLALEVI
jgi:predicted CoA-binding protein